MDMSSVAVPLHGAIAKALLSADFEGLFLNTLEWQSVSGGCFQAGEFTAGPWPDDLRDVPPKFIGWQNWADGSRLVSRYNNGVTWIPISAHGVEAYTVTNIASWHANNMLDDESNVVYNSFSPRRLAESLRADILQVFDEFRDHFKSLEFSTQVFPTTFSPLSLGEQHAIGAIGKVVWLSFMQKRVDCHLDGNCSYLKAILETWESQSHEPSLEARVTTSIATIMCDRSDASRTLVHEQVGTVPRLNQWLVHPSDPETVVTFIPTQSILPDEFLLRLIGEDGILWRYPIMLRQPRLYELGVHICPEMASGILDTLRKQEPEIVAFRIHERCQWEIAAHLGIGPLLRDLKPHHAARLDEFFVADPDCQTGQYVCAMVHELMIVRAHLCELRGEEWRPIEVLRSILGNQVRGYSREISFVRAARVRLAQVCMSWVPDTNEVELTEVSECLRIGSVAGLSPGPLPMDSREGPTIEFKATFEWNKRLGQRDANIRLSVIRTICAFMNSQGGTVYIGVNDNGEPIGADDDFALINDDHPEDMFAQKLTELLRRHLEPYAPGSVEVTFPTIAARRIVAIEVEGRPGITYLKEKAGDGEVQTSIYVRDGNRTLKLQGRERDRFVLQRFRSDADGPD